MRDGVGAAGCAGIAEPDLAVCAGSMASGRLWLGRLACLTPEPCIGGRAWPAFKPDDERWAAAVLLWANTTLGLISFWWAGTRQQQGRSNLTVLRLPELATLDPRALTDEQLSAAADIFDRLAAQRLLPANEAWRDEARQELDRVVLADLLGLDAAEVMPALAVLRYQWCLEPSVHGGKATRPSDRMPL